MKRYGDKGHYCLIPLSGTIKFFGISFIIMEHTIHNQFYLFVRKAKLYNGLIQETPLNFIIGFTNVKL